MTIVCENPLVVETEVTTNTKLNEISVRVQIQFKFPTPCSDSSGIREVLTQQKQWSLNEVVTVTGSVLLVAYLPVVCCEDWIHLVPGWVESSPTRHRETMAVLRMPWFWLVSERYTNRMMCRRYTISHGSSNKQTKAKTTQGWMVVLATAGTWVHRQI